MAYRGLVRGVDTSCPCEYEGAMLSFSVIKERLEGRTPLVLNAFGQRHAAVALVVCEATSGLEVLFIERSEHERDPWSGHLGFPGGRVESSDSGPREAAVREAFEEVGLDLTAADYLGRLDDLEGAHISVLVSCFVFGTRSRPDLKVNPSEVRQAFWMPVAELLDESRRREKTFHFRGESVTHPAIQVLEEGRPWLWGITYRLVSQFFESVGCSGLKG